MCPAIATNSSRPMARAVPVGPMSLKLSTTSGLSHSLVEALEGRERAVTLDRTTWGEQWVGEGGRQRNKEEETGGKNNDRKDNVSGGIRQGRQDSSPARRMQPTPCAPGGPAGALPPGCPPHLLIAEVVHGLDEVGRQLVRAPHQGHLAAHAQAGATDLDEELLHRGGTGAVQPGYRCNATQGGRGCMVQVASQRASELCVGLWPSGLAQKVARKPVQASTSNWGAPALRLYPPRA